VTAQAIVEMRDSEVEFLHLQNPSPVAWNAVVGPISELLQVPLVSYGEWLSRVEALDSDNLHNNPCLQLLDFFKNGDNMSTRRGPLTFPTLSMEEAMKVSPQLKQMRSFVDDLKKWLTYWKLPRPQSSQVFLRDGRIQVA
jgi:hypothetical protein